MECTLSNNGEMLHVPCVMVTQEERNSFTKKNKWKIMAMDTT